MKSDIIKTLKIVTPVGITILALYSAYLYYPVYKSEQFDEQMAISSAQLKIKSGSPLNQTEWALLTNENEVFQRQYIDINSELVIKDITGMKDLILTVKRPKCDNDSEIATYTIENPTKSTDFFGMNTVYSQDFSGDRVPSWSFVSNEPQYTVVATCINLGEIT